MTDCRNGVCSFVGDWKTLKHKGFKYYRKDSIVYLFEGLNGEHPYSNINIKKVAGIVSVSQLTGCLHQVLTFIRDELDGCVPNKLYINKEKGIISQVDLFPYDYKLIFMEEGLDVIYQMFLEGEIVYNPRLSLR